MRTRTTGTADRNQSRRTRGEAGFILISVLWLAGLVALLALTFASEARVHIAIQRNAVADAQAQALADGGVMLAIERLLAAGAGAPGTPTHCVMPDGSPITFAIHDEGGKIDINLADEPLLRALMRGVGIAGEETGQLIAALLDYRDSDGDRRRGGAEAADYRAAGRPVGPRNGPLVAIEELGTVLGFTPQVVELLLPHVTVLSGQPGLDPRAMTVELARIIAAGLDGQRAAPTEVLDAGEPPVRLPSDMIAPSSRRAFTIRSRARSRRGSIFVREATISVLPAIAARAQQFNAANLTGAGRSSGSGRPQGIKIWSWRRGAGAASDQMNPDQTGAAAC